jgi:hypothetical protein
MNSTRGRSLSLIVVGSITLTAGCAQHRVATSFGELEPRLTHGQTIYVTTVTGETHKGKLEALSAGHARVTISGSTIQVPARETGSDDRAVVLSDRGRDLLEANRCAQGARGSRARRSTRALESSAS